MHIFFSTGCLVAQRTIYGCDGFGLNCTESILQFWMLVFRNGFALSLQAGFTSRSPVHRGADPKRQLEQSSWEIILFCSAPFYCVELPFPDHPPFLGICLHMRRNRRAQLGLGECMRISSLIIPQHTPLACLC